MVASRPPQAFVLLWGFCKDIVSARSGMESPFHVVSELVLGLSWVFCFSFHERSILASPVFHQEGVWLPMFNLPDSDIRI